MRLVLVALVLAGCDVPATGRSPSPWVFERQLSVRVLRIEDQEKGVTCWVHDASGGGIFCLPDSARRDGGSR